jgi:hypothetical protein
MKKLTPEYLYKKVQHDKAWLERAIAFLDASDAWHDEDRSEGHRIARKLRQKGLENVAWGKRLDDEYYLERARAILLKYRREMLELAMYKALRQAARFQLQAEKQQERANQIAEQLTELDGQSGAPASGAKKRTQTGPRTYRDPIDDVD